MADSDCYDVTPDQGNPLQQDDVTNTHQRIGRCRIKKVLGKIGFEAARLQLRFVAPPVASC